MAEGKKIIRLADVGELEARLLEALEHPARQLDPDGAVSCSEAIMDELEGLKKLPTIDPESLRPVAHWEESVCFDDAFWVCSNCKFPSEAIAAPRLYHYCPNCGAKMEGATNE